MSDSVAGFPYEAIAVKKYKSPHKNDLSFAKGERVKVTGQAPKDDDDDDDDDDADVWLIGESLDGTKQGSFPASHVEKAAATIEKESAGATSTEFTTEDNLDAKSPEQSNSQQVVPNAVAEEDLTTTVLGSDAQEPLTSVQIPQAETPQATSPAPTSETVTAEAKSPSKPSSPPLAPKPSGLAARIAAFNKPQESAPPPLPRGKPGGWKPPPPAPGGPKPLLPGMSAAQLNKSTAKPAVQSSAPAVSSADNTATSPGAAASTNESQQDKINAGFSAADAQSSIKMSLKERMAALQAGGTATRGDSDSRSPPVKPSTKPPGKIDEGRRAAALAQLGDTNKSAEDIEQPGLEAAARDATDAQIDSERQANDVEPSTAVTEGDAGDEDTSPSTNEQVASEEQEAEKSQEQIESDRRAAIAARMAKLGGRRMGTGPGPALFGAPAPGPVASRQSTEDTSSPQDVPEVRTEGDAVEEAIVPSQASAVGGETTAPAADTLAVPRRTAPPRRKKASSASSTQAPALETTPKSSTDVEAPQAASYGLAERTKETGAETIEDSVPGTVLGGDVKSLTTEPEDESASLVEADTDAQQDDENERAPSALGNDDAYEMVEAPPASAFRKATGLSNVSRDSVAEGGASEADNFEPGTPVSHSELEEHARQLEAFVRTPDEAGLQDDASNSIRAPPAEDEWDHQTTEDVSKEVKPTTSQPAPSSAPPRPPSTRPPVPKTPTPASTLDVDAPTDSGVRRLTSPPPSRAPPIPFSAATPARPERDEAEESTQQTSQGSESIVLAAPKPRLAVPTEDEDDEENEEDGEDAAHTTAPQDVSKPVETTSTAETGEEEDERQRRRRLAERMARMGAQPIMGAPMPFRNRETVKEKEDAAAETVAPEAEPTSTLEIHEDVAADDTDALATVEEQGYVEEPRLERLEQPDAPAPVASPPPIPTKSPPPPVRSPDAARRGSQVLLAGDLSRSGSIRTRPPVPGVTHSRQGTLDDREEPSTDDQSIMRAVSPPVLPSSPPPRMPMRAPPARQPSIGSDQGSVGARRQSSISQTQSGSIEDQNAMKSTRLRGLTPSGPSPRDLDVMPSSHWWRHGRPVRLPPSLMRPDAVLSVTTDDDGAHHLVRVDLIFEDYSSTNISVLYQDDDATEEHTQVAQIHHFAPSKPSAQELASWSQMYGSRIASTAATTLGAGSKGGAGASNVGDGSSKGFIDALVATSTHGECLPSVGNSFGALLLGQAATTVLDQGADEARPGDIVALHGTDFKGKRGITSYHATYGTANEPAFACIVEVTSDAKKRKLRCILTSSAAASSGRSGRGGGGPEEVSLRLDDVKSGLMRIYRVAPRIGWLPN